MSPGDWVMRGHKDSKTHDMGDNQLFPRFTLGGVPSAAQDLVASESETIPLAKQVLRSGAISGGFGCGGSRLLLNCIPYGADLRILTLCFHQFLVVPWVFTEDGGA